MLTKREKVILNGPQEMLLSFVPPQLKKKRLEHANGEQEERAAGTEKTAAVVC